MALNSTLSELTLRFEEWYPVLDFTVREQAADDALDYCCDDIYLLKPDTMLASCSTRHRESWQAMDSAFERYCALYHPQRVGKPLSTYGIGIYAVGSGYEDYSREEVLGRIGLPRSARFFTCGDSESRFWLSMAAKFGFGTRMDTLLTWLTELDTQLNELAPKHCQTVLVWPIIEAIDPTVTPYCLELPNSTLTAEQQTRLTTLLTRIIKLIKA